MRAPARLLLLCLALLSPTAGAGPTGEMPRGNFGYELAFGLGGALLMVPTGYTGYSLGYTLFPPYTECDSSGCFTSGFSWGAILGMVGGGLLGLSAGTGYAVAWAGQRQGGAFTPGPPAIGSILGGLAGLLASIPATFALTSSQPDLGRTLAPIMVCTFIAVGGAFGGVMSYEATNPFLPPGGPDWEDRSRVQVAPVVLLVPGGGGLGLSGTF